MNELKTKMFDTFPDAKYQFLDRDCTVENPKWNRMIMWFTVPSDWAEKWISDWEEENNLEPGEFLTIYDWYDTSYMYECADADDVILREVTEYVNDDQSVEYIEDMRIEHFY